MEKEKFFQPRGFTEIIYFIGGGIVFLGVIVLVWQQWTTLTTTWRIAITLGSGLMMYALGALLAYHDETNPLGRVFFLLGSLIVPVGFFTVFDAVGFSFDSKTQTLISLLLCLLFAASFGVYRYNIFLILLIASGIWLFFASTSALVEDTISYFDFLEFFSYRALFMSIVLMFFGYVFSDTKRHSVSGICYGFGIFTLLASGFALNAYPSYGTNGAYVSSQFWRIVYPLIALTSILVSVFIKQRSFLIFGSLFLAAYIINTTLEYFTESIGWPVAIVFVGLSLIAIGYASFIISRKYSITPRSQSMK